MSVELQPEALQEQTEWEAPPTEPEWTYLESRVHLQEVEVFLGVHQKLHGSSRGILHSLGQLHRLLPHGPPRVWVQEGTGARRRTRSLGSVQSFRFYTYLGFNVRMSSEEVQKYIVVLLFQTSCWLYNVCT